MEKSSSRFDDKLAEMTYYEEYKAQESLFAIKAMLIREEQYIPQDYLSSALQETEVNAERRSLLIEWCFRVVDHFGLCRNIVAYTMNYVDRFCSRYTASIDHSAYKLVTTTALYVSLKLHLGGTPCVKRKMYQNMQDQDKTISWNTMAKVLPYLTNGEFTLDHLSRFEIILLQSLGFLLNPPLPFSYLEHYIMLFRPHLQDYVNPVNIQTFLSRCLIVANSQVDLATSDSSILSTRPSLVALASLLNAMDHVSTQNFNHPLWSSTVCQPSEKLIKCLSDHHILSNYDIRDLQDKQEMLNRAYAMHFTAGYEEEFCDLPRLSPTSTAEFESHQDC